MKKRPLTAAQESEAKRLEANIRAAVDQEIASLARLLVSTSDQDLFGRTEFQIRDLLLRMGAKAYDEYLREKKMATKAPPSTVPAATTRPSSRPISG
jgi:hypothetical protein